MKWLGLNYDEGPFYVSDRGDIYNKYVEQLIESGDAYRCYCTRKELIEKQENAMEEGRSPIYDRRCRTADQNNDSRPFALRLRVPGTTIFKNLIKRTLSMNHDKVEDIIIRKSDGSYSYNFITAIDDYTMGITHIIERESFNENTPKQILIYKALGFKLPEYTHLPTILGSNNKRLSKPRDNPSVKEYRDAGYLPRAIINYIALISWSHGDDKTFSPEELVQKFSIEGISKSPCAVNHQKLLWLNKHHIAVSNPEDLIEPLVYQLNRMGVDHSSKDNLVGIIESFQGRSGIETMVELAEATKFNFNNEIDYYERDDDKFLTMDNLPLLEDILTGLTDLADLEEEDIRQVFWAVDEKHSTAGILDLYTIIEAAITGSTFPSPNIFKTLKALGKDDTLKRMALTIDHIKAK